MLSGLNKSLWHVFDIIAIQIVSFLPFLIWQGFAWTCPNAPCLIAILRLLLDCFACAHLPLPLHLLLLYHFHNSFLLYYLRIVILALQHLPFIGVNPKVHNPFPLPSTYHHKIYLLHNLVFSKKFLNCPRNICLLSGGNFFVIWEEIQIMYILLLKKNQFESVFWPSWSI